MAAGSLSNVGEPKFRTPEVVRIGNNPPPTTPPGMFVAPPPPDTTWLDLENREYSEFQISVDANFHITTIHANNGARFRLFIYRSTDAEIAVDINPWLDEVVKIPGKSVSKVYVLNVECYQVSGEEYLRYKVTNLIFDHEERKDKTWSSSKIKETINAVINDEEVSLTGTWSSTKLKQAIDSKQDKIESSLQVDEIVRKSNAEIGGLTFLSKSTHKDWGDREDQWPSFQFISRVFDGYGNVVFESIPLYLNGAGVWEAFKLNATSLTLNNLRVATESFVNAAIQNLSNLMSTDAERIAAINELTQSYNAADDQLQQTLTTALATKAGKAVNEEISGIYNFLNGLLVNGISLNDLFLGKSATAENSLKLGGLEASQFLRGDTIDGFTFLYKGHHWAAANGVHFGVDGLYNALTFYDGVNAYSAQIFRDVDSVFFVGARSADKSKGIAIDKDGNVGIKKTTPTEALDVQGNGIFKGFLKIHDPNCYNPTASSDSNYSLKVTGGGSSYGLAVGVIGNGNTWFQSQRFDGGTSIYNLLFNPLGGKVGIGTYSPTEALDVNGNGVIRGNFTSTGFVKSSLFYIDGYDITQPGTYGQLDFNPGTALRIGRKTNASGFRVDILRGNNTTDTSHRFYGYGDSFINALGGNLGIKTTTPTEALDVNGNIKASGNGGFSGTLSVGNIGIGGSLYNQKGTAIIETLNRSLIYVDKSDNPEGWGIRLHDNQTNYRYLIASDANDNISIFCHLNVTGNIVASGTITNGSDRRQKTNIQPLTSRGELNPVTFIKNGKPDLGFIAQEVKELYPELVAGEETEDTFLSLNYSQLTAVLYAELKELRAEVKHLKQLIQNDTNV